MKKLYYILVFILVACNSENAPNCIQSSGSITTDEVSVSFFSKIRIEDDVSLIIRQGDNQKVLIETGDNLRNDVEVTVLDETLIIKDNNRCNFVRDFGITKAIVTTPNLTEIRNSSEFDVIGEGILNFNTLSLISDTTGNIEDTRKSGDFTMTINCENFSVDANGFSAFYISGFANNASITFQDEIPRFEGRNLEVNDLRIFQRSANVMIVNPIQRIRGSIRGTGDVIAVNRPPEIDVEEFFTGRLLFED